MYYYIYQLSYDNVPFYIGVTQHPVSRYIQHCNLYCGYVRSFSIDKLKYGLLPDLKIIHHCQDKYEAFDYEKSTIETLTTVGIFLVNADHNSLYNYLIIKEIDLHVGYNLKMPRNYINKIKTVFNTYINDNKIPVQNIAIKKEEITDYTICRDIVNNLQIGDECFITVRKLNNFRKYLVNLTFNTGKKIKTKTIEGRLKVIRIG